ncbi:MAG: beta-lactamase family protein, partial [Thermomicrobium sp.]|nr:beta-lactamase family protein [Thermomicrobium sp.]
MGERLSGVVGRIQAFIERDELDGAGLLVVRAGSVALEWYGGDAAPGVPAAPYVLWPLASISKLYTAATILALVEHGVLTLNGSLGSLVSECTDDERRSITVRQLLTHTSGMPYESPAMEDLLRQRLPLEELIEAAFTEPLDFLPGTRIGYSDLGYALLGIMAERATGRPFPELMRQYVFEPARLDETHFPLRDEEAETRLARVVGGLGDGTPWAMYGARYGLRIAHPAWGVVATVRDVMRFLLHFTPHAPGRLLSRATVEAMTRRQTPATFGLPGWGLGFEVGGGFFGEADLL